MKIAVTVTTRDIPEQTDPSQYRFVFAYTITITNEDTQAAQLMNRYWLITDANSKKVEVKGPGVVGEQPVIKPGESYTYTSGCILETEVGTMEGFYEFAVEQQMIEVPIPVFRLAAPNILH
jgi:ApaG protein